MNKTKEHLTMNEHQPPPKAAHGRLQEVSEQDLLAGLVLAGSFQGALLIKGITAPLADVDTLALMEALKAEVRDVQSGKSSRLEENLLAQGNILSSLFYRLMNDAMSASTSVQKKELLLLSMKVQRQYLATIEAYRHLKAPANIINQVNLTAGHQQINNLG